MKEVKYSKTRVIAHLGDYDIEIKPKGKSKFSTTNEAIEARNKHLHMFDDIELVVKRKVINH